MPEVYMTVGLPGSGKTTHLKRIMTLNEGFSYVCGDDVRAQLYGSTSVQTNPKRVWSIVYQQVRNSLKKGQDVLIDGTFVKRVDRKALFTECGFHRHDIEVTCLLFQTPLEVCLQNNRSRDRYVPEAAILRMDEQLRQSPPVIWEGYKEIVELVPLELM